jgi:hypothetical protein
MKEKMMPPKIDFTNTSGQALMVELGQINNFINGTPPCFDNGFDGYAQLALLDVYGMFFKNGDVAQKPLIYFRHTDVTKNKHRFVSLLELGDDYLAPQKGVFHVEELAGSDTPVIAYGERSKKPKVYGYESKEKLVECRFFENEMTMKEGDFFDIKAYPWQYTVYDHQSIYRNSSVIFQPSTFLGTFDKEPIIGLGSYDRFCIKRDVEGFDNIALGYITLTAMGIRDDGRKEVAFITASLNSSGKTIAYYFLEGELPIITDHVKIEADWVRLPYVNDGTCVFKEATFYFCNKEIHFEGKWGTKGFSEKPRIEKSGQSQVFGTWYEGRAPYQHRLYFTFVENMNAYDFELEKLGFNIIK